MSIGNIAFGIATLVTVSFALKFGNQSMGHAKDITGQAISGQDECKEAGFFGSVENCRDFYICVSENGKLSSNESNKFQKFNYQCLYGTIYDPSITICNFPEIVRPKPKCMQNTTLGNKDQLPGISNVVKRHQILKDDIYEVEWNVDFRKQIIKFKVAVKTKGYVGFGISFTGSMVGADIIIGGVFPNGTTYFTDRYARGFEVPKIDESQDWTLKKARENDTHTVLWFSRKLNTCDLDDVPINNDTIKIIWCYGKSDDISYHGINYRGNVALNLIDTPTRTPDLTLFQTWRAAQAFNMPKRETTYWCTFFKGPAIRTKHHVVGFDIYLNGSTSKTHTHHADLYKCTPPNDEDPDEIFGKHLGYGYDCYFSSDYFPVEYCQLFEFQWTIGGKTTMFPDNVGVPFGEDGLVYFMTEIHYNNPEELSGLQVFSGMEFYYTDKLRPHDAGFLQIGILTSSTYSLTIPPNSTDFVVASHCPPSCTNNFPEEGVNVFVYLLHSHLSGRKERLRHFRNGEELPWIANDDHFDFNYQSNRPLRKYVKLLPGDHLTLECTYDTNWKMGRATLGGRSARDEMCQTFLMYYPRMMSVNQCVSFYPYNKMLEYMGIEEVSREKGIIDPTILAPPSLKGLKYSYFIENRINWSKKRRNEFQNLTRFGSLEGYCITSLNSNQSFQNALYPAIQKRFDLPDWCANKTR